MPDYNIFLENAYADFKTDEVKIYNDILKMTDYIVKIPEVFNNSCLKGFDYNSICFDIVLTNNDKIRKINLEYRQKDSATDVITFAIFADSPQEEKFILDGEINLGEIIISVDKIEEQSRGKNISFENELYYIISHGILHLLGFDHQTDEDYNFMTETQNKARAAVL